MSAPSSSATRMPVRPFTGIPVLCVEQGYLLTKLTEDSACLRACGLTVEIKPYLMVLTSGFGPWHMVPHTLEARVAKRNQTLDCMCWQLAGELKLLRPIIRFPKERQELSELLEQMVAEGLAFASTLRAVGIWECDSLSASKGE
ncbi:MAG: hypothetical protein AB8B50_04000 [Pirellulaceae bacterium]